jgi:hypothetical protein
LHQFEHGLNDAASAIGGAPAAAVVNGVVARKQVGVSFAGVGAFVVTRVRLAGFGGVDQTGLGERVWPMRRLEGLSRER